MGVCGRPRRTCDSCQGRRRSKGHTDKMRPARQTQASDDVEYNKEPGVGSAKNGPLPDNGDYDPCDNVRRAD